MANNDYLPDAEGPLRDWLENFYNVCTQNAPILQLTPTDLEQIEGGKDGFNQAINATTAAESAYRSEVANKASQRRSITSVVRKFAKEFKANPNVTPALQAALGIATNGSLGPVVTVTGLTVVGCDDGVNKLQWNRGANGSGTVFLIESRLEGSTLWTIAAATTKSRFSHTDQIPGQKQYYRVTSTRAGISSAPSAPVVVYGNGSGGGLSLAA